MIKLDNSNFCENLILLSMVGGSENVKAFRQLFEINPKVFYGLNTANKFNSIDLKYDPQVSNPEIHYYSNRFPGTIGCHMNHYYAIHHALVNDYDFVVLMEDDVIPNYATTFTNLVESYNELPEGWDCLNFGWIESIVLKERHHTPISYSDNLYSNLGMECSGAFGYILSKNGIKKSLSLLSDIRMATDYQFKFLNCYYTKIPFVNHPPAHAYSRIRG